MELNNIEHKSINEIRKLTNHPVVINDAVLKKLLTTVYEKIERAANQESYDVTIDIWRDLTEKEKYKYLDLIIKSLKKEGYYVSIKYDYFLYINWHPSKVVAFFMKIFV